MKTELLRLFQYVLWGGVIWGGLWVIYMLLNDDPFRYDIATAFGVFVFLFLILRSSLSRMKTRFDQDE